MKIRVATVTGDFLRYYKTQEERIYALLKYHIEKYMFETAKYMLTAYGIYEK